MWDSATDLTALAENMPDLNANALATCIDERQTQDKLERDLAAAEYVV